jgi:predicted kinase
MPDASGLPKLAGFRLQSLQPVLPMCYKRIMREWVREKLMRRRKKPVANNSESTGKIGHEIPQNQPSPLQPSYPPSLQREEQTQEHSRAAPAQHAAAEEHNSNSAEPADAAQETRGMSNQNDRNRDRNQSRNASRNSGTEPVSQPDRSQPDGEIPSEPEPSFGPGGNGEPVLVHETQPESLATPPAALQVAPAKGYVVLTIGLPGSGKTTWFKRRGVTPLSSDMLRSILFDDITEQRYQGLVFSTLRSLLRARLIAKMPWNYVDATNLSPHERRQWIKMARSFGYEVQAVFFDVPFEVCMQRNLRRDRMLNEETMAKMQERLRPPSFKEGFHKITVVRVKNSPTETPAEAFDPPQE